MRNVHEFDGKVPMRMEKTYTEEEIKRIVNDAEFLNQMSMSARHMSQELLRMNNRKNYDPLNQHIDAQQLYVALLQKICQLPFEDKTFFQYLLQEQLEDMKNLGSCPQGRTIRLWQLLQSL